MDFKFTAGRFDLFRSNVPGKSDGSQVIWTLLTTTCMYHPALLLMPSCVFTRAFKSLAIDFLLTVVFVMFTSSCIKKMGLTKYRDFACLGVCIHIVCMEIWPKKYKSAEIEASLKNNVISRWEHRHLCSMMDTRFSKKKITFILLNRWVFVMLIRSLLKAFVSYESRYFKIMTLVWL